MARRPRSQPDTPKPATAFVQAMSRALDLLAEHGVAVVHEDAHRAMTAAGATPGRGASRLRLLRIWCARPWPPRRNR